MPNLIGKDNRLFAEVDPGRDPTTFQVDNTSQQYYNSPYFLQHKDQIQPIPKLNIDPPCMNLGEVLGDATVQSIQAAKVISFHTVGDTGATNVAHLADEESVADMMAADLQSGGAAAPWFFFHLGDIVYNFGEAEYYYEQFYDPFRAYDRPIFAIPGNHDGMVYGDPTKSPSSLQAYLRNFCATQPGPSKDAGGLIRSAMTQPGAYFSLEAPMLTIIGLYSNVLDGGPGVISSENGHYPIPDSQIQFLQSELTRLKPARQAGERAIVIAVHHPPVSADAKHGGSTGLSQDIDAACQKAGVWPDAVLSGHAHLYQRCTRRVGGQEIPYLVSGSGGYNAKQNVLEKTPKAPFTQGDTTLEIDPVVEYGYMTVTVDMRSAAKLMTISFSSPKAGRSHDQVTVDLVQHKIVSGKRPAPKPAPQKAARVAASPGSKTGKQPRGAPAKSRK